MIYYGGGVERVFDNHDFQELGIKSELYSEGLLIPFCTTHLETLPYYEI